MGAVWCSKVAKIVEIGNMTTRFNVVVLIPLVVLFSGEIR